MLARIVTTLLRRLRPSRAIGALVLLVALLSGAAAHAWHHVVDRDCDRTSTSSRACGACSALHGASLGEDRAEGPTPVVVLVESLLAPETSSPAPPPPPQPAPRGPPIA